MEANHNFDQMMKQLIQLLNKMMSNHFPKNKLSEFGSSLKDKGGVNFNFYVLNVTPLPEDLEDWDDLEEEWMDAAEGSEGDISQKLSRADLDFLRRHGIQF
ncbi:MAG: hypothetical protein HYZ83_02670 [Candidatus Omnitrophica bacterium]|nr:hypothetical protein [Candidatus Omnitrophota bacterium]